MIKLINIYVQHLIAALSKNIYSLLGPQLFLSVSLHFPFSFIDCSLFSLSVSLLSIFPFAFLFCSNNSQFLPTSPLKVFCLDSDSLKTLEEVLLHSPKWEAILWTDRIWSQGDTVTHCAELGWATEQDLENPQRKSMSPLNYSPGPCGSLHVPNAAKLGECDKQARQDGFQISKSATTWSTALDPVAGL